MRFNCLTFSCFDTAWVIDTRTNQILLCYFIDYHYGLDTSGLLVFHHFCDRVIFSSVLTLIKSIEQVILLLQWDVNSRNLRGVHFTAFIMSWVFVPFVTYITWAGLPSFNWWWAVIFSASPSFCVFRYHGYKQI